MTTTFFGSICLTSLGIIVFNTSSILFTPLIFPLTSSCNKLITFLVILITNLTK